VSQPSSGQQLPISVPATQQPQSSGSGGVLGMIAEGMAFGTGNAIAHRAVGAIAESFSGGNTPDQPQQQQQKQKNDPFSHGVNGSFISDSCSMEKQRYDECLGENKGDQSSCQFLYNQIRECQTSNDHLQFH
jgi:coiled-coil-helix-coiled-coil-helix domain-containing protein 10